MSLAPPPLLAAIGPFAAIYFIWQNGEVDSNAAVPTWVLVIGGVGIVIGLATCKSAPGRPESLRARMV